MSIKKCNVTYRPKPTDFIVVGIGARIYALNHPKMGELEVRTSRVLSYDKDAGVFETLNSIYVPEVV